MSTLVEEEMSLEDLATMCENQEELADLILQEVPFYTFKTEPVATLASEADAQVTQFMDCDVAITTDIMDIAQEETCCSNDCYNTEMARSPDSDDSMSRLSPLSRKKCCGSRKIRTPNTLQHILEKHRHSERKRHHSLNERLKAICQLVPGSANDNRETKVVMMQRVISYIAYLENTVRLLCSQMGSTPHLSWVLLTTNFANYFHDYFKGIEDSDGGDEVLTATRNLSKSQQEAEEDGYNGSQGKVSSPTVDSSTDSVVPVGVPPVEGEEVVVMSQDSGVAASSLAGEDEEVGNLWALCDGVQMEAISTTQGDAEVFFRSSMEDGVSAMLEISSTAAEDKPLILGLGADYRQEDMDHRKVTATPRDFRPPDACAMPYQCAVETPMDSLYTIQKHMPEVPPQRRHKRKQLSPRRSASQADYLSDRAYLPSWSTVTPGSADQDGRKDTSPGKARRVLPYNIRCNHRHPVQRLQAAGAKLGVNPSSEPLHIPCLPRQPEREPMVRTQDRGSTKLDLRKTSWMNGFMMFSRLNRRHFIQAHPGVHTSHISKIMGHAWRNMSKEDQAPYKEKAQLCARELYRVYTGQSSVGHSSTTTTTASTTTTVTTTSVLPDLPPSTTFQQ